MEHDGPDPPLAMSHADVPPQQPPWARYEPTKVLTLVQAQEALLRVRPLMQQVDDHLERIRELSGLLEDMTQYWGTAIDDPTNPEHPTYQTLRTEAEDRIASVDTLVQQMVQEGAYVKSLPQGLVDFYAVRADGQKVFLCWRRGEEGIGHWHTLEGGYVGRRPLADF